MTFLKILNEEFVISQNLIAQEQALWSVMEHILKPISFLVYSSKAFNYDLLFTIDVYMVFNLILLQRWINGKMEEDEDQCVVEDNTWRKI